MSCLFCKIIAREIPAEIVFENDHVLAFKDIHPAAPTHALVIPKRHIAAIHDVQPSDAPLLGELMLAGRAVALKLGVSEGGYRLVINNGADAGQSVHHVHLHVLGGRALAWPPG